MVTSRRVASIKQRVAAVAAANRHTVAVLEGGHVYSWGCNLQGQLGYGTSDSASNAAPRIVEGMKVSIAPPKSLCPGSCPQHHGLCQRNWALHHGGLEGEPCTSKHCMAVRHA